MAIAYIHWVMHEAEVRDPAAWRLLVLLADCADEAGRCWPSVDYLVRKTGLSESTVHRLRRRLRALGAFTEERRVSARGRQASNLITLDRTWRWQDDPAVGGEGCQPDTPAAREGCHLDDTPDDTPGVSKAGGEGCHLGDTPVTLNRQEPSVEPKIEEDARALEDDFLAIVAAFAPGKTEPLERGRRTLAALSLDDRAEAVRHARAWVVAMRAEKRKLCSIATYLADRRWESIARIAGMSATERAGGKVFVKVDTPAWRAWERHLGKRPPTMRSDLHGGTGWYFPTLFPPGHVEDG